jgi:succinate dehydrogenase / fumarate reductase cytochrome b subunit
MNHSRPKNLNLFTIRFPLPAIISILHRISGFILFLLIPILLSILQLSLKESGFILLKEWMQSAIVKSLFWVALMPLCYHFVAGLRHLLSDLHIGNTRKGGKLAALLTLIVSIILVILVGIWLW